MCIYILFMILLFFFFKRQTSYECRISDWISDVCSSDRIAGMAGLVIADYDGMSETYFMDGKTLSGLYNEPGVWEAALTDELRFVDHSRSVLSLLLMEDAKAG